MKLKFALVIVIAGLGSRTFAQSVLLYAPTDTSSAGNANYGLQLTPTLNQTGTAGFTDLFINRTETAIGSGHQYFQNFQVGGVDKWIIDHTGTVTLGTWSGTAIGVNFGGTGQTTASAAFNALSPMTTLGDIIYGDASGAGTRLAGNISITKQFLTQAGTGSSSAAPAWGPIAAGDITGLAASATTDTTNASNITSGLLGADQLPAFGERLTRYTICAGSGTQLNSFGMSLSITAAGSFGNVPTPTSPCYSILYNASNTINDSATVIATPTERMPSLGTYVYITQLPQLTAERFWVGIFDSSPMGSDTYGGSSGQSAVGFRFSTGASDTNFQCVTGDGSGNTIVNSGIAANSSYHTFKVIVRAGTSATFYIDGSLVATITTHVPTAPNVIETLVGIENLTAASKAFVLLSMASEIVP